LGDGPLQALNLMAIGLVASEAGRRQEAEERLAEALVLFRRSDDPWGLAIALNARAQILERLGRPLQARDLYAESLELNRELQAGVAGPPRARHHPRRYGPSRRRGRRTGKSGATPARKSGGQPGARRLLGLRRDAGCARRALAIRG